MPAPAQTSQLHRAALGSPSPPGVRLQAGPTLGQTGLVQGPAPTAVPRAGSLTLLPQHLSASGETWETRELVGTR